MHSYKPYRDRVLANRDFLAALLAEIGTRPAGAAARGRRGRRAHGRPRAPRRPALGNRRRLRGEPGGRLPPRALLCLAHRAVGGHRPAAPPLRPRRGPGADRPPWYHRSAIAKRLPRPRLPGAARLAGDRGAPPRPRPDRPPADRAGRARGGDRPPRPFAQVRRRAYEGLTRIDEVLVTRAAARKIPAGSLDPADQPAFEVAVALLEPTRPTRSSPGASSRPSSSARSTSSRGCSRGSQKRS